MTRIVISGDSGAGSRLAADLSTIARGWSILVLTAWEGEVAATIQDIDPDLVIHCIGDNGDLSLLASIASRLAGRGGTRFLACVPTSNSVLAIEAIRSGASGVVTRADEPALIARAVEKVCSGELWLDRTSMAVLVERMVHGQLLIGRTKTLERLTAREREIVDCLVAHPSAPAKRVAREVRTTLGALRNRLSAIYRKLAVNNRAALLLLVTSRSEPSAGTASGPEANASGRRRIKARF